MQDPNLPPGCTSKDIDLDDGAIAYCDLCGKLVYSDALNEDGVCKKCVEQNEIELPILHE